MKPLLRRKMRDDFEEGAQSYGIELMGQDGAGRSGNNPFNIGHGRLDHKFSKFFEALIHG